MASGYRESILREDEDRWRQTVNRYGLPPERRQRTALERTNDLLVALVGLTLLVAALQVAVLVLR